MIRILFSLFLTLNLFAPAFALPSIQVQSDEAEYRVAENVAIHRGKVVISQDGRKLTAEEVRIYRSPSGAIQSLVAVGHPAKYDGPVTTQVPSLHAEALSITYDPEHEQLVLEGLAKIVRKPDIFQSARIEYDISKRQILSSAHLDEKTTLQFTPKGPEHAQSGVSP